MGGSGASSYRQVNVTSYIESSSEAQLAEQLQHLAVAGLAKLDVAFENATNVDVEGSNAGNRTLEQGEEISKGTVVVPEVQEAANKFTEAFAFADTNKDGRLSKQEAQAVGMSDRNFERLDVNN